MCIRDRINGQSTGNCRINLNNTTNNQEVTAYSDDFSIFPNPAQDLFTVTFNPDIIPNGKLTITNMIGHLIQSIECNTSVITVNTLQWASGVYYIQYTVSYTHLDVYKRQALPLQKCRSFPP